MSQSLVADTPVVDYIEPAVMVQTMISTGASKADLGVGDIFVRGMLGGALLAFATSICFLAFAQGVPTAIAGLLFPVGFIIINLTKVDLITGYFALVPLAFLHRRMSFGQLLRAWIVVWAGNLVGSVAYVYIMWAGVTMMGQVHVPVPPPPVAAAPAAAALAAPAPAPAPVVAAPDPTGIGAITIKIGLLKTIHYEQFGMAGAIAAFMKAMLCNWMVTLGVVLPYTSRSAIGKVIATFVPIYMFFAMGYEHMVVNMFIIPAAMMFGAPITQSDFWIGNELPVTLGNFAGGFLFTAAALGWTYRARTA
jgi:formate/nitrite transporter